MSEQEPEPLAIFTMGDRSCNTCMHAKVMCMWPTTGSLRQVCFGCQWTHGKCEIGGKPVTVWGPRQVGVHKKRKITSKVTIEEDGDDTAWVLLPAPKAVGAAESPLEKAIAGIVKEMKASWKSSERIAQEALKVSHDMLSQMTALVDLVELVIQGKRFMRMQEMGWPESDREELLTRWSKKGKGKAKEDESEEEPEEDGEAEEEGELEVEPEDVDMTLG